MACWNDKREADALDPCPICYVMVSKRKKTNHITNCYNQYNETLDERGLIRCPLSQLHIVPKRFLNHHLDGNCQEAQNMLRKYFQKMSLKDQIKPPPPSFLSDVPDELLSYNNKQLLYILKRDLEGNIIVAQEPESS